MIEQQNILYEFQLIPCPRPVCCVFPAHLLLRHAKCPQPNRPSILGRIFG